ncbi:MAG: helix-turn-helix domain-containing protein [Rhodospirillales bacterium]|nr:helix-turn-helix domain-containing protein [Rhodospirillales bacterium]
MITPLDWPSIVDEALKRRRDEGLTQKEHAAIAGVSIPTIIAFDRKQTRLSLNKAMDILRVVGLVAEQSAANLQDAFVEASGRRWEELVSTLADGSPARQPYGSYIIAYELSEVSFSSVRELQGYLKNAASHKYSGWPPFWLPTRPAIAPYPYENGVECWLGQPDAERVFGDAAHSDFWRASLDGRLYLRCGYQEDATDMVPPATIFDLTLPVWRTGEALLHAYHLAEALKATSKTDIRFSVRYGGLAGRELKSWANPYREVFEVHRCRIGEVENSVVCEAAQVRERLEDLVYELLVPVYESFDFFELKRHLVKEELSKLQKDRSGLQRR